MLGMRIQSFALPVLAVAILLGTACSGEVTKLRFTDEGTFKIIQFTDMHFGDKQGDEGDSKSQEVCAVPQNIPDRVASLDRVSPALTPILLCWTGDAARPAEGERCPASGHVRGHGLGHEVGQDPRLV